MPLAKRQLGIFFSGFTPLSFALAVLLVSAEASSQTATPDVNTEIKALRQEVSALRQDISEIKENVAFVKKVFDEARQKNAPVHEVSFKPDASSADDFFIGQPQAPVVIMEFFDFQCSFCAKYHKTTLPRLRQEFIDTGKVKFIFRDYLLEMHPMAAYAAAIANCSGEQNKYMEAQTVLFDNPEAVSAGEFEQIYSKISGLNMTKLESCLSSEPHRLLVDETGEVIGPSKEVELDMAEAERLGVMGTPAFFIGPNNTTGVSISGVFIRGDQDFEAFKAAIEKYLPAKK